MRGLVIGKPARNWRLQHVSAAILAVCVVVHILVIIYAVNNGLTGDEILGRTRGNWSFGLFYAVFVLACVLHVPTGLTAIMREWLGFDALLASIIAKLFGLIILFLGLQAVYAVTMP